jgi:hypothetical protein
MSSIEKEIELARRKYDSELRQRQLEYDQSKQQFEREQEEAWSECTKEVDTFFKNCLRKAGPRQFLGVKYCGNECYFPEISPSKSKCRPFFQSWDRDVTHGSAGTSSMDSKLQDYFTKKEEENERITDVNVNDPRLCDRRNFIEFFFTPKRLFRVKIVLDNTISKDFARRWDVDVTMP